MPRRGPYKGSIASKLKSAIRFLQAISDLMSSTYNICLSTLVAYYRINEVEELGCFAIVERLSPTLSQPSMLDLPSSARRPALR